MLHYVTVDKKTLTALSLAMSTDESRYYLKGVYFHTVDRSDDHENNHVLATATDGHLLVNVRLNSFIHSEQTAFIAPSGFVKAALKAMKAKGEYTIGFDDQTQEIGLYDQAGVLIPTIENFTKWNAETRKHEIIGSRPYREVDGTYPDYARLIRKSDLYPEDNDKTYAFCKERKRIVRTLELLGDKRETLSFRSTGLYHNAIYRSPEHTLMIVALRKQWVGEIDEKDNRVCVDLNTGAPYTES